MYGRRAEFEGLEPLHARLVVILDQRQTLADRLLGQMVEADGGVRDVVEQRLEAIVEQWQPVLHAGIALAGADGLIERILRGRRAEHGHIAAAKRFSAAGPKATSLIGIKVSRCTILPVRWVSGSKALMCSSVSPKKSSRTGLERPGGIKVENAAAHGVLAGLHDRAGALETGKVEPLDQLVPVDALAGRDVLERPADELARRQPLQNRVDRGEHDRGPLVRGGRRAAPGRPSGWPRSRRWVRCGRRARCPKPASGSRAAWGRRRRCRRRGLEPAIVARNVQESGGVAGACILRQPRQHQRRQPIRARPPASPSWRHRAATEALAPLSRAWAG